MTRLRPFAGIYMTGISWAVVVGLGAAGLLILAGRDENQALYWGVAAAAGLVAFLWAAYRVSLEIDSTEIRVVNVRKTYRVPWESVARIDTVDWWLGPGAIVPGNSALRITTRHGERVVIDASTRNVTNVRRVLAAQRPRSGIIIN